MALRKVVTEETNAQEADTSASAQDAATEQVKETVAAQEGSEAQASSTAQEAQSEAQPEPEVTSQAEQAQQTQVEEAQAATTQEPDGDDTVQPELASERKEVATAAASTAVAPIAGAAGKAGVMAQFTQAMAEEGFEGLNVTGMSFDRVKLDEGKFVLGSEETSLGETFDMQLMGTRPIYVVRKDPTDEKSPVYFSYDPAGMTLTDGSSAAAIREEWLEDGYGGEDSPLDTKRYLEGMATMINRTDEYEGHMISVLIPPTSTDRLSGAIAVGLQKFKLKPDQLVLRATVGGKIKKGNTEWRPWLFKAVGPIEG